MHEPGGSGDESAAASMGQAAGKTDGAKGLTQEQLAFEAEIDLTYVGGIERGKRDSSLLVMARTSPPSRRINCAIIPGASYDPLSPTGC
jgi:Helix-turn-helix